MPDEGGPTETSPTLSRQRAGSDVDPYRTDVGTGILYWVRGMEESQGLSEAEIHPEAVDMEF
jgi:hypothetical protein